LSSFIRKYDNLSYKRKLKVVIEITPNRKNLPPILKYPIPDSQVIVKPKELINFKQKKQTGHVLSFPNLRLCLKLSVVNY
jgi:hypothetical protein